MSAALASETLSFSFGGIHCVGSCGHLKCHSVAPGFRGSEQQSGSCHLSSQHAVGSEGQTERKVPMRCRKLYFTMWLVQKNRGSGLLFLRGFERVDSN